MNKEDELALPNNHSNPERGINRRQMVRRLMLAGSTGFVLPGIAEGHPVTKYLASGVTAPEASAGTAETEWVPKFLDQHQFDTLAVLGERIIPGSSNAETSQFIDLLLSVETRDGRKKFLASLSAFEAEALRRFSHPYKGLDVIQQNAILASASTARYGEAQEGEPLRLTMRDHFENLKSWVSGAYYSSEIGMKELGWTGQVFFTSFPGCQGSGAHRS